MITVQKSGSSGVYLPDLRLGLDCSPREATACITSHAHSDHTPPKKTENVYASPPTVDFLKLRGYNDNARAQEFGQPLEFDNCRVTLYPAGHILGSAMIYVESDDGNLLYTGDFRRPPSPASEGFESPERVDILVTEATFGLPIYKWEPHEVLFDQLRDFARQSLDAGYTPLFLGYSLGKAHEIMHALAPLDHPMQVHGAIHKLCDVYEKHGIELGEYEPYDRETAEGKILITPSSGLSSGIGSNISKVSVAYCSGWAALEARRSQMTVDRLITLSDHADFFEVLNWCKELRPRKVYLTHTPNPAVLQHYLDKAGIESAHLDMEVPADD